MKKEVRIEGNAFSKRRRIIHRTESPDEMSDGMRSISRFTQGPWEAQRPLIEWAKAALAQERSGYDADDQFKSHEDAGWYLSEIVAFAEIADFNIAKGDPRWAAYAGARFGELWSEFQLQMARGELYCKAVEVRSRQAAAGEAHRKGSDADRLACYRRFREMGLNKTDATDQAAKELGVSPATIRSARKGAGASD